MNVSIDRRDPKWRDQLAPFAPVLAAMITAAATDFDTAMKCGVVDNTTAEAWAEAFKEGSRQ